MASKQWEVWRLHSFSLHDFSGNFQKLAEHAVDIVVLFSVRAFKSQMKEKKKTKETKSKDFMEKKTCACLCGLALTQGRGQSLSDVKVSVQPTVSLSI